MVLYDDKGIRVVRKFLWFWITVKYFESLDDAMTYINKR